MYVLIHKLHLTFIFIFSVLSSTQQITSFTLLLYVTIRLFIYVRIKKSTQNHNIYNVEIQLFKNSTSIYIILHKTNHKLVNQVCYQKNTQFLSILKLGSLSVTLVDWRSRRRVRYVRAADSKSDIEPLHVAKQLQKLPFNLSDGLKRTTLTLR